MRREPKIYRKTDNMLEEIMKNIAACEVQPGYPKVYLEGNFTEDCVILLTMKDGLVIEIRDWHAGSSFVRDISVEKAAFDRISDLTFEAYAISMGLYAGDLAIRGTRWNYFNRGEENGAYRLQYNMEE